MGVWVQLGFTTFNPLSHQLDIAPPPLLFQLSAENQSVLGGGYLVRGPTVETDAGMRVPPMSTWPVSGPDAAHR